MRRICFDTASNYFKPSLGVGDVDYHRALMQQKSLHHPIKFHCAVAYDEENQKILEFREDQATELVILLGTADQLISHSGRRHDLLVLEQVCGAESVSPLHQIAHHDLFDIFSRASLESLAQKHIPHLLPDLKDAWLQRLARADERWPELRRDFRSHGHFIDCHLASARWDVERTFAVFKAYVAQE